MNEENNMSAFAVGHLTRVKMGPAIVEYLKGIDATLAPFGGKFRVQGDPIELLEGEFCGDLIVIEFPNMETARQWYASPAYQAIMPLRTATPVERSSWSLACRATMWPPISSLAEAEMELTPSINTATWLPKHVASRRQDYSQAKDSFAPRYLSI
jgi:uncharacterized protein (DUF1330 family)